jgi:hypothetical protein
VKAEAGGSVGVVGDLGAAGRVDGRVGLAGGDDGDAASGEQGTEADAEGEGVGFLGARRAGGVFEGAAGVVAAMGRVENYNEPGGGCERGRGGEGEGEEKD